jgi:hypothetical protein
MTFHYIDWSKKAKSVVVLLVLSIIILLVVMIYHPKKGVVVGGTHNQSNPRSTPSILLRRQQQQRSTDDGKDISIGEINDDDNNVLQQHRRGLFETTEYDAQIFLELQYVGNDVATEMETHDPYNPAIVDFCRAVQQQVRFHATRWLEKKNGKEKTDWQVFDRNTYTIASSPHSNVCPFTTLKPYHRSMEILLLRKPKN